MSRELYFLRSSEQKIVKDMVKIAKIPQGTEPSIYTDFYGLTTKDLGLYAMVDNEIAGAIWSRKLDRDTPQMCVAIVKKFKEQGIDSFMMDQFLQEAGALFEAVSIDISAKPKSCTFYEKFGFQRETENDFLMIKKLEKKEVYRPSDGYDPTKWMD
ncbi:MAG: hypothetical protein ACI9TV_002204 [Sulfurimonas sp.]|jgi:hypothetical protein|uniref:GNAT family N-acetyltransferase n=1 Tax=Sulfurimonas sp. TaxID=2022749 RepID=UPI0039E3F0FF